MRSFLLILFLGVSLPVTGAWYWPFGGKDNTPAAPPVPSSNKFQPIDSDQSKKLYPKVNPEDGVSVKRVKKLADNGNINAQLTLGKIYFDGLVGEKQDYKKAYKYFGKAAIQGNPEAMYNVAICYDGGFGVQADIAQALAWYKKAADNGVPEAQLKTAVFAESQNQPEVAFKYYKMLADAGEDSIMLQVALSLLNGYGVEPNPELAAEYLLASARKGNLRAQVRLADCYQAGLGVPQDNREMFRWLTLAAHDGDPEAQAKLGTCYLNGIGTIKNPEMAFHWIKISADSGYADGEYLLGNCHRDGIGTAPNDVIAFEWYRKAAEHQDAFAQLELAKCYDEGRGCNIDAAAALEWLTRAADSGLALAQARLAGTLADNPDARPADLVKAELLLSRAVASKEPLALVQAALCCLKNGSPLYDRTRGRTILEDALAAGSKEARFFLDLYFPVSVHKD